MELIEWFAIAGVCFAGAATPGASLVVVVRNTSIGGRAEGIKTAIGHGVGVGLYALFAVAGFSALVETMPTVVSSIETVGALFLLWMGAATLWSANNERAKEVERSAGRGAVEGFLFAFMNPKIILFFLAILSTMLPPEATGLERVGVATVAMLIDAGWYTFAVLMLSREGPAMWLELNRTPVDRLLGLILIAAGVALLF
jgi:threonine/homoserine/homoserine lactone efflux protein